jgi:hypothetical protein
MPYFIVNVDSRLGIEWTLISVVREEVPEFSALDLFTTVLVSQQQQHVHELNPVEEDRRRCRSHVVSLGHRLFASYLPHTRDTSFESRESVEFE